MIITKKAKVFKQTDIVSLHSNYTSNIRDRDYANLKWSLIVPACVGLGTVLLMFLIQLLPREGINNLLTSIYTGLLTSALTFLFIKWLDVTNKRMKEGLCMLQASEDAIKNLQVSNIYSSLAGKHLFLSWNLAQIFSEIVDQTTNEGGGILIAADDTQYSRILEETLDKAQNSLRAILRGGEDEKFRPSKLFSLIGNKYVVFNKDIESYLHKVNRKKIDIKQRIMIYNFDTIKTDFGNNDLRNYFFDLFLGEDIMLYLASPKTLEDKFGKYNKIWNEDYAIFDDILILKHNIDSNLLFASIGKMECYSGIFDQLEKDYQPEYTNDMRFIKVTKDKIGPYSWDEKITENGREKYAWEDWLKAKENIQK